MECGKDGVGTQLLSQGSTGWIEQLNNPNFFSFEH